MRGDLKNIHLHDFILLATFRRVFIKIVTKITLGFNGKSLWKILTSYRV